MSAENKDLPPPLCGPGRLHYSLPPRYVPGGHSSLRSGWFTPGKEPPASTDIKAHQTIWVSKRRYKSQPLS